MKFGNVRLEEIDAVVNALNLSVEKADEVKKRLKENITSFLPCDIPQETLIAYSQSGRRSIIDFMYSAKSYATEMDAALAYPKHSYNIGFISKRIGSVFDTPEYANKSKELYYRESFCTEEMMGKSADFYYKWYLAAISFIDYKNKLISASQLLELYEQSFSGITFAGNNLERFFQQMIDVHFLAFQENRDSQKVINFYNLSKTYDFDLDIYEYMIQSKFSTDALNPEKYIIDLWDMREENFYNYCSYISSKTGLSTREIMDFLIDHSKIDKNDIFNRWNSGDDPMSIASDLNLEIEDVQNFLKENLDSLVRKSYEDLWQLESSYYDSDDF